MACREIQRNISRSKESLPRDHDSQVQDLKNRYSVLIDATQAHEGDVTCPSKDTLYEILEAADQLYESNKEYMKSNPRVVEMDLRCIHMCASLSKIHARSIVIQDHVFRPTEFAKKIVSSFGDTDYPSQVDWSKIGAAFIGSASVTPTYQYMFGLLPQFNLPLKLKRGRNSYKEKNDGPVVKPIEATTLAAEEKTSKMVDSIFRKLKRICHRPFCYFTLVVNPLSYSKTIENMFHVSFLAKDGLVKLYVGESGIPMLSLLGDKAENKPTEARKGRQLILSMEYHEWEKIKSAFKITKSILN